MKQSENRQKVIGNKQLAKLSLAALGVVFGDIGTSPLYAIRECFYGDYGISATRSNVLGVLSLIFWALILVVTIKYLTFILRADNRGEGGIIALTSLIRPKKLIHREGGKWLLVAIGVFGACLLYGDGMITPAISVMSAIEGLRAITMSFDPYVLPITVVILAGLFLLQPRGTGSVGALFGPVIFCWFSVLGVLGLVEIVSNPAILAAILPTHAIIFFVNNRLHGFIVLGAVFLVVTGAEALYADMGHFGRRPIRLVWLVLVFPALFFNYFGQGAHLLKHPEAISDPFYAIVPSWGMIPMVFLATAATIIASQAVISGAFSLTRQAVQLGYLPRIKIVHTSARHIGQIYVPSINWLIMASTIALVLGFGSSSKLAAAYGVAVTSTMLISTVLFYVIAREKWKWNKLGIGMFAAFFLIIDISFFLANLSKLLHGAWFPLVIGALFFIVMITWKRGREMLYSMLKNRQITMEQFLAYIKEHKPERVNGEAIFLTGSPDVIPEALLSNLAHNKVLHSKTAILHIATKEIPVVPNDQKVHIEKLAGGFHKIIANYGFMEYPNLKNILYLAREKGLEFDMDKVSYFLGREKLNIAPKGKMMRWRARLFSFMSRNAMDATDFFEIPPSQMVELGVTLEL